MILVSNGFNKFHLTRAAAELNRMGCLTLMITGAYPKSKWVESSGLKRLANNAKYQRLLARQDAVEDRYVRSLILPEIFHAAHLILLRYGDFKISTWLNVFSFQLYGYMAAGIIKAVGKNTRIYHYRAGFGGQSVQMAKTMGMITLCDYSFAHPAVASFLVNNGGAMPRPGTPCRLDPFHRWLLDDIQQADAVVVNSSFVKQTFADQVPDTKPVHTVYLGVDNQFMTYIRQWKKPAVPQNIPLKFLFAGALEPRKGAAALLAALQSLSHTQLSMEIIGYIHRDIEKQYDRVFRSPHVRCHGILPRHEVAKHMLACDVFVFPSLSEGSARVVFEAMACGCYIITTPNSGAIVQHGVHGALIRPDDRDGLIEALQWALKNRRKVSDIGRFNAALIRRHYTQRHYGRHLYKLYHRLAPSLPQYIE